MPRYFFHLRTNHDRLEDEEGTELADVAAARVEARSITRATRSFDTRVRAVTR
jgi:hypothetical protein